MDTTLFLLLGIILAASGLFSPALALVGGLAFGFFVAHPMPSASRSLSRFLLQASVVLLGFGMNLREVLHAGRDGFFYTALSITLVLLLGWGLGRLMNVSPKAAFLITCGTAICGGSAIAAIAPVTDASEEDMAVSLGTVFTLNALALLLFPVIGWHFHLTQTQFGLWSALAIHDTSSVVGAAERYGPQALAIGTAVKLARALWIVPVSLVTAAILRRSNSASGKGQASLKRVQVPWFIGLFILAATVRTFLPQLGSAYNHLTTLGKNGLTVVLFLIGTGLSRETLKRVGVRPMVQGVVLWIFVATASLFAIRTGWIALR